MTSHLILHAGNRYQEEFLDNIQCDIQSLARQTRANDLFAMALRKTDPPLVS